MFNALLAPTVGIAVAAATVAAVSGCSTPTKVTDQWRDPSYAAGPMHRVVVIGLDVPPATRRLLEDRFASDLDKRGVQATASYTVFGDQLPDKETARATLASSGFDGVLVLRLQRVSDRARYVPGDHFYGMPYTGYWGSNYYGSGYYVTDEIVNFETSLWDLRDGKRVWTANTRTENPSSGTDTAKSLSKKVVPELTKKGLVTNSPQ
jgi:hypothetical protein